jgi:hypothetical protein
VLAGHSFGGLVARLVSLTVCEKWQRHGTPMRDCWVKTVQQSGSEVPRVEPDAIVA